MNVMLLNPPSPFLIDQKSFVPLGLLALAGYVRDQAGHGVRVADLANQEDRLEEALDGLDGDVFGVSATTPQYPYARSILGILRKKRPGARVVLGGVHPTCAAKQCLADGWDHVFVGEGERAFAHLLDAAAQGREMPAIVSPEFIEDLDTLPFPGYDAIPLSEYGYRIDGHLAQTLITSRGCPFNCAFCSKDVWPDKIRFHSPEYVERLVRHIRHDLGYQYLQFLDDSLVLNRERVLEICRRIAPYDVRFRCYGHVRSCTREVLEALKRAGCIELGVGIESGSQKILDTVGKKTSVEDNTRLIALCREIGIASNAFLMIGLPGETRETVAETRAWVERARPDKFGYNIFMPYLGTPIYNHPERYDITIYPVEEMHSWVKGRQGEYHAFVATSELSREEILSLFEENFKAFTELTRWRPGFNERIEECTGGE